MTAQQAEGCQHATGRADLRALGTDAEKEAIMLAFGRHLKSLRVSAGLSQEKLAWRCSLRYDAISEIERGLRMPGLLALLALADALGVSVGELTQGLHAPTREADRAQVLALIASQPGKSTEHLAELLALPAWYVVRLVRRLEGDGKITSAHSGWRRVPELPTGLTLTPRELEVLSLLSRGKTHAEIACALGIGIQTVYSHAARVRQKFNVKSKRELVGVPVPGDD